MPDLRQELTEPLLGMELLQLKQTAVSRSVVLGAAGCISGLCTVPAAGPAKPLTAGRTIAVLLRVMLACKRSSEGRGFKQASEDVMCSVGTENSSSFWV